MLKRFINNKNKEAITYLNIKFDNLNDCKFLINNIFNFRIPQITFVLLTINK